MRKIVVMAFVTADGVMQAPGGPEEDPTGGFGHGGWVVPYWDEDIASALERTLSEPFDLLLGRRTYDIFAAHWPYVEMDPAAADYDAGGATTAGKFNDYTKYVATHHPDTLEWQNSRALGDDVVGSIRQLKQTAGPDLLVQGSSELLQALHAHDLIDEFRLLIYPVVLGNGKRLFGEGTRPRAFEASSVSLSASGVSIVHYRRSGEVPTGSFAFADPTEAEQRRREQLTT